MPAPNFSAPSSTAEAMRSILEPLRSILPLTLYNPLRVEEQAFFVFPRRNGPVVKPNKTLCVYVLHVKRRKSTYSLERIWSPVWTTARGY